MNGTRAHLPGTIWTMMAFTAGLLLAQSSGLAAEKEPRASWRLRDKREQLNQLKKELNRERQQVKQVARKEQSLFEELDRIDQQLQQKGRELRALQAKLRSSTERLQGLQKEIGLTQKQLSHTRGLFWRRVRAVYKHGRLGYVRAVFSSDDLSAAGRRMKYLAVIANQDQRMVATYTSALDTLQMQQAELERSKAELVNNQKAVTAKREEILREQRARRVVLAKVQNQKKAHLTSIRQLELAARELQGLIGRLQSAERLKLSRRPAREAEQPVPAPSDGRGAFAALKGRLPWPTSGTVGSSFGRQEHPRHRTVTFNRGIEINAPRGQKIVAVSGGTVLYADWFKGYGQLIVLDHGDGYYTVYAHVAEILVKLGDRVVKGQSIGLVGDTGSVTGSQLYFEVRHRGRPQDPLAWLAPS